MHIRAFLEVLATKYGERADDFVVTIGHQTQPFPDQPVTIYNLPEIQGDVAITVGDIRRWLAEVA